MKRKFLIPAILILICTPIVLFFLDNNGDKISHFKQYLIKSNGSLTFYEDESFELSFLFLDEVDLSEMKEIKNIETIHIGFGDEELTVESYSIQEWEPTKMYDCKLLSVLVKETEIRSETMLDNLAITFGDGIIESFPIGKLKFTVKERNNHEVFLNLTEDYLVSKDKYRMPTGWITAVQSLGKPFSIIEIKSGVEGLIIDYSDFIFFESMDGINVLNHFSEIRHDQVATEYDVVSMESLIEKKDFIIEVDDGIEVNQAFNSYVFKVLYDNNFDFTECLYLTPEYTLKVDGDELATRGSIPIVVVNPYINIEDYRGKLYSEGI